MCQVCPRKVSEQFLINKLRLLRSWNISTLDGGDELSQLPSQLVLTCRCHFGAFLRLQCGICAGESHCTRPVLLSMSSWHLPRPHHAGVRALSALPARHLFEFFFIIFMPGMWNRPISGAIWADHVRALRPRCVHSIRGFVQQAGVSMFEWIPRRWFGMLLHERALCNL